MRFPSLRRSYALAFSLAALALTPACSKKTAEVTTAEAVDSSAESVTEENDAGSIQWVVSPEGKVTAKLASPDGKPITKDVSGQLTWKAPAGDTNVPATVDANSGVITASGPKLEDDLTQIDYAFTVAGKPWTGSLQVPRGGTKAFAEGAKLGAATPIPADKLGPNGGVIQVVGNDRIEVVADKGSGQVRVYVLDADLKPVAVGDRRITLGLGGDAPEIVVLTPDASGLYCSGKLVTRHDPRRITINVAVKDEVHAAIVGWSPGLRLVVGHRAPHVHILVATWDAPTVDVHVHDEHHGPVIVVHDDDDERIDVKLHGKHGHKGKASISVKIH